MTSKQSFHKYLIPRVRYLDKAELFKQLSRSIIAFDIAHRDLWIFSFFLHRLKHETNCGLSISFSLVTLIDEELAKIVGILFGGIQIHTHSHRSFVIIDIKHAWTELAV